jgi:predicted ATPase
VSSEGGSPVPGEAVGIDPPIRTPDQRVRVFVSSTLEELADERVAVRAAIERLRLTPVLFELGARPHPPTQLYRSYLAQSDVFVGIYGQRYGWIAPGEDRSGLEDEFERATALPQLLYVREPAPERDPRLEAMLDRLRETGRASYRTFTTPEELAELVQDDLMVLLTERFSAAPSTDELPSRGPSTPPLAVDTLAPLTATIGRDDEIARLVRLLTGDRTRLVTVTGPGGVGKSRLVLEVARRVPDAFPDGVRLVLLEPIDDPSQVLRVVADQLGVGDAGAWGVAHQLVEHLRDRQLLLVVDNFEHVLPAAPDIAGLLDRCPQLQVLTTSRRPLRLRGEVEAPLRPLALPTDAAPVETSAAVQLFLARARAVRPDLDVGAHDLATIADLVAALDGLPLGIELAAARLRLLTPAELLARLGERLDVLGGGAVDLPVRQRTLRATLDWSYRLLDPDEQRLLERCSVFRVPASLDALRAVAPDDDQDVESAVTTLVEASLAVPSTVDGCTHIGLLRTVRSYGFDRLAERGELDAVADRHADWFLQRVRLLDPAFEPRPHRYFTAMVREMEDVRAAMDHVLERRDTAGISSFASATWAWFWQLGRIVEALPWFEAASAVVMAEGTAPEQANCLRTLAHLRQMVGDCRAAVALADEAMSRYDELDDDFGRASVHLILAASFPQLGRTDEVAAHAEAALALGERIEHAYAIGFATSILGTMRLMAGRSAEARTLFERSRATGRGIAFDALEAQADVTLAMVDAIEGHVPAAWGELRAAARLLERDGNLEILGYWFEAAAMTALREDAIADAAVALRTATAIREELQLALWPLFEPAHAELARTIATHLAEAGLPSPEAETDPPRLVARLLDAREEMSTPAVGDAGPSRRAGTGQASST